MEYWNSELTEKSWKILQELSGKKFEFVLIGGWAAYLWTNAHKSKDIDIVLKGFDALDFLKKNYKLIKNDSLKKYEIKFEEIDVDIYMPFFSKLAIPAEELIKYATKIENIEVVKPEALLILKQGAEIDRQFSVKGEKDRVDIMALLLFAEIDFSQYLKLLEKYNLNQFYDRLKKIILNFNEIKYLGMVPRQFKIRKKEVLEKIRKQQG